jgi:hypothetical protein
MSISGGRGRDLRQEKPILPYPLLRVSKFSEKSAKQNPSEKLC